MKAIQTAFILKKVKIFYKIQDTNSREYIKRSVSYKEHRKNLIQMIPQKRKRYNNNLIWKRYKSGGQKKNY